MSATSGKLEALKLFKVFRSILERRMSGTLTVRRSKVVKQARFAFGQMLTAMSNRPEESLARALVEEGLISSTERSEIDAARRADRRPFEAHVSEKGLVAAERLDAIRRRIARHVMIECFGWHEGDFIFKPSEGRTKPQKNGIDAIEILLEAAATVLPTPICQRFVSRFGDQALAPTDRMETYAARFDAHFPPPNLRGIISGPIPASQFVSLPGDKVRNQREATAAVLAGLFSAQRAGTRSGAMPRQPAARKQAASAPTNSAPRRRAERSVPPRPASVAPHPTRNEPPARRAAAPDATSTTSDRKVRLRASKPAAAKPPEPRPARRRSDPSRSAATRPPAARSSRSRVAAQPASSRPVRTKQTAQAGAAPAGSAKPIPDKIKVLLDRARVLRGELGDKNHYELLGVPRDADDKAIRLAFRKLARDFHADRFARYGLDKDTLSTVQKVFIAVNRANEVLSKAEPRAEYDASLDLNVNLGSGNARQTAAAGQQLDRVLQAERQIKDATVLISRGQAAPALDRLKSALEVIPDDPVGLAARTFAEHLLAQAQGGSQVVVGRARDALEEICEELDNRAEPFLYLGRIYRRLDEPELAIRAFQRALKINPHLAEARSELRHVQRKAEQSKSGLAGLFGRRKK